MLLSSEIWSISSIVGEEKAIELLAKAGFTAWDFSLWEMARFNWSTMDVNHTNHPLRSNEYLKFARQLKKVASDNGIVCNQSHAPYPTTQKVIRDNMLRAIECASEAGAKYIVIHPFNDGTAQMNAEYFNTLIPFAKEHNIIIATENMWNWDNTHGRAVDASCSTPEDFVKTIDLVSSPYFSACLDIGHSEMMGRENYTEKHIFALKDRLTCLHIHDNDKIHDSHQIPFSMQIKYEGIVKALKAINYKGDLTLEADRYVSSHNGIDIEVLVKNLYMSVKKLKDMFDRC